MQPPSESEDETAAQSPEDASFMTEDKEVTDWVRQQTERRNSGLLQTTEKPALHAVALDKVATSPIHV